MSRNTNFVDYCCFPRTKLFWIDLQMMIMVLIYYPVVVESTILNVVPYRLLINQMCICN